MDYLVSVYTCVYNGEKTIHRVFDSIKNQTYRNIEHIIINDGSTDSTAELVQKYMQEVDYPVNYFEKENGGKHTAVNMAWDNARGYFAVQLDADDELLPDAIEFLVNEYNSIPDDIKENVWCVHGRCIDQLEHKMVGEPYPEGINQFSLEKAKEIAENTSGEKFGMMKVSALSRYRYPTPAGVSFVTENYVWHQLNRLYRTWYTNHIVRIYYINEGESLSNPKLKRQTCSNYSFDFKYELENRKIFNLTYKKTLNKFLFYIVYRGMATKEYKKSHPYFLKNNDWLMNFALFILAVPGRLASFYFEKKWKVSN